MAQLARQHFPFDAYADRILHLALPSLHAVTCIVPNFNYARYLPDRLSSIFCQTRAPASIIVLDDGSTDESAAVVQREAARAGRPVRWSGSARNTGRVFGKWRRAAELAETEFVWIAEADDLAEPGLLDAMCHALRDAPDAVFAFSDSRAVDGAGTTLWPDHQDIYRQSGTSLLAESGVIPGDAFLAACLGARNLVLNASAVLWRCASLRAALERSGKKLDEFRLAGDWYLYAEALAGGGSVAYVA